MTEQVYLFAETAAAAAMADAVDTAEIETRGKLAELLANWTNGEITTLQKALQVLREGHVRTAKRYRDVSIIPRPFIVQKQLDFCDHAASALDNAIGCLEKCKTRRKKAH